ncbi:MAG: CopG family transcriptional regulator [Thermoproteota archaeon]
MADRVQVSISKELYEKAKKFIEEQGGFSSVDELVEFLLQEVLSPEEQAGAAMSKEDEEKVKERLRALGYI